MIGLNALALAGGREGLGRVAPFWSGEFVDEVFSPWRETKPASRSRRIGGDILIFWGAFEAL